jgi:hypothetical protein
LLNTLLTVLLNAVANLRAKYIKRKRRLGKYLAKLDSLLDFTQEAASLNTFFRVEYNYKRGLTCRQYNISYLVDREQ